MVLGIRCNCAEKNQRLRSAFSRQLPLLSALSPHPHIHPTPSHTYKPTPPHIHTRAHIHPPGAMSGSVCGGRRPLRQTASRQRQDRAASMARTLESEACGICLRGRQEVEQRGRLPLCDHFYCHDCILAWSRRVNSCPLCKQTVPTQPLLLPPIPTHTPYFPFGNLAHIPTQSSSCPSPACALTLGTCLYACTS